MVYFPLLDTGWIHNALLPTAWHRVDPQWLTSHCLTQEGRTMVFFPLSDTGWAPDCLPHTVWHMVDPQWFTSHCLTQGGPTMVYFLSLHTGWTHNGLLPTASHRVDPQWFTSYHFTQGGPTMVYFLSLHTGWTHNGLLPTASHRVDPQWFTSHVPDTCAAEWGVTTYNGNQNTGWTLIGLPHTVWHRVDPQWFTSHCLTQGGPTMVYFPLPDTRAAEWGVPTYNGDQNTGWTLIGLPHTVWHRVGPQWFTSHCLTHVLLSGVCLHIMGTKTQVGPSLVYLTLSDTG